MPQASAGASGGEMHIVTQAGIGMPGCFIGTS